MAANEITINTSILSSDIAELSASLEKAKKQLENMACEITELNAMWEGPAHAEFNRQFASDYENTRELFHTVESIIDCMKYANQQYDLCENEVGDIISMIQI